MQKKNYDVWFAFYNKINGQKHLNWTSLVK